MNDKSGPVESKTRAQHLRKNMTPEERQLWYCFLNKMPWRAKRQQVFGNYIVDFYVASAKLVIEVDGSQHYGADGLSDYDKQRDAWLETAHHLKVLHVTNYEVNTNFRGVCETIQHEVLVRQLERSR